METVAPVGPMYQGGTLSGNPVATAAGLATLRGLQEPGVFEAIAARTERLTSGLRSAAAKAAVLVQTAHVGTMAGIFFNDRPVTDYADAKASDTARYARFFHGLLRRGVYLAPSQFETCFLSAAHTDDDIEHTIAAAAEVFAEIAESVR
jgi:glutamate-1-semialdehyde 2,1-aminomutase